METMWPRVASDDHELTQKKKPEQQTGAEAGTNNKS